MARELLRSVDGRQMPNLGEVAVYWPHQDYTDVFDTTGFEFNDEARYGDRDGDEYPELIEHDAEATAKDLLAALQGIMAEVAGCQKDEKYQKGRAAIAKATGSKA